MTSTIQVRIDSKMKNRADKTFKNMGLDMSSGVKLYLHQVVRSGSIPFTIRTENGFTPEQEHLMIAETKHALKYGKRYKTAREMMLDILGK
ncbi:MAG: type II toxin-antitoxin system RelB/DinJ family antitoxin [Patescibacteria group bacterium]